MSTENKQQSELELLKAKQQQMIFDLGRITYAYEAARRAQVDNISTAINKIAELTKSLQNEIDAAAAPKTSAETMLGAAPISPEGTAAATPAADVSAPPTEANSRG
jgi:hypothetical protein